jgi:hypothetical protein
MLQLPESHVDVEPPEINISLDELWLRCFALGSMNTTTELETLLLGSARPTRHEYNVIAVALNEYFIEVGLSRFLPYIEDDTPISASSLSSAAILAPHPLGVGASNG